MKLLLMLLLLPMPLLAQSHEQNARRILESPEYKGYRVERDEADGSGSSTGGSKGEDRAMRRDSDVGPGRNSGEGGGAATHGPSGASWLGGVLRVVLWVLVIAAALVALFFIVKALLGIRIKKRRKPEKSKASKSGAVKEDSPAAAPSAPEFADALALARREYEAAIAAGDWARAALIAYRIFWLQAGWRGCVEESDVRTWRDALRMVRQGELRARIRELLGMIERVRYGEHVPAKPEYETWKARLDAIEPAEALR